MKEITKQFLLALIILSILILADRFSDSRKIAKMRYEINWLQIQEDVTYYRLELLQTQIDSLNAKIVRGE
jgi:hypothetical protein